MSVIAPLALIPLLLSALGEASFGVWATVTSVTSMLVFADLGLGSGLLTRLSAAFGDNDLARGRRLVSNSYIGLSLVALVGLCTSALVLHWFDVSELLGVRPESESDARGIVAVVLSAFFVSMPLSLIVRVQLGVQQAWQSNIWAALGPVISVPIVWTLVTLEVNPVGVVAGATIGPLAVSLVNSLVFFNTRQGRPLRPTPRLASVVGARELVGLGSAFAGLSILSNAALNVDNLLISAVLGSTEVATFAIAWRLFRSSALLIAVVGMPLWGASGEALARGDLRWIRRVTVGSAIGLTATSIALISPLVIFRQQIIEWWVGPDIATPMLLYVGLGIWSVLASFVTPFFMVQNAAGLVRIQVLGWGSYFVLSVSAKLVGLNAQLGIEWVPLIAAASYAVTVLPSALLGYRNVVKTHHDASATARRKSSRWSA